MTGYSTSTVFPGSMTEPHGARNTWLRSWIPPGTLLWVNLLGSTEQEEGWGILSATNGQVIVAGVNYTAANLAKDAFVSRLDGGGHLLGTQSLGGTGDETVTGLTSDVAGNLYISGSTSFSDFPLTKPFDSTLESARAPAMASWPCCPRRAAKSAGFTGRRHVDAINALSIRSGSRLVVAGQTSSSSGLFSTTFYDATLAAPPDGFIVALDIKDITPPVKCGSTTGPRRTTPTRILITQTATNFLAANWEDFMDNDSPLVSYECGFGTAPGLDDVSLFTATTPPLKPSCSTQKQLTQGRTYYVTVRATNDQGLVTLGSSNGVLVGEAPSPDGGTGNPDGGTTEPPAPDDKALLGWSCAAAEAGPLALLSLVALLMLERQRGKPSR